MAYVFNWARGEFDEITVTIGVPATQLTLDGEAEAPMVAVTNGLYSKLLGAVCYGFNTGSSGGAGAGQEDFGGQRLSLRVGMNPFWPVALRRPGAPPELKMLAPGAVA